MSVWDQVIEYFNRTMTPVESTTQLVMYLVIGLVSYLVGYLMGGRR